MACSQGAGSTIKEENLDSSGPAHGPSMGVGNHQGAPTTCGLAHHLGLIRGLCKHQLFMPMEDGRSEGQHEVSASSKKTVPAWPAELPLPGPYHTQRAQIPQLPQGSLLRALSLSSLQVGLGSYWALGRCNQLIILKDSCGRGPPIRAIEAHRRPHKASTRAAYG